MSATDSHSSGHGSIQAVATYAGVGTARLSDSGADQNNSAPSEYDGFFTIHGVAIGVGDVTYGKSRTKKFWPAQTLKDAAKTLEGKPLVRDHINNTMGKIGVVVAAEYVDDVGVVYEAKIAPHYEEIAKDIDAGLMDVSIRAYHPPEEELDEDDETGALIVPEALFDNLSVVDDGAAPSNSANSGTLDESVYATTSEASAVGFIGDDGDGAIATLERGVDIERFSSDDISKTIDEMGEESVSGDPELDGYVPVGYRNNTPHHDPAANVVLSDQITNGEQIVLCRAEASRPFSPSIHREGDSYPWHDPSLSSNIGYADELDGGEVHTDVVIELDEPVQDGEDVHVVFYYTDENGNRINHMLGADGWIHDSATVYVDESAESPLRLYDIAHGSDEMSLTVEDVPGGGEPYAVESDHEDVYETKEAAQKRADEIGCDGVHGAEFDDDDSGEVYYIPCENMDAYQSAVESMSGFNPDACLSCGIDTDELSTPEGIYTAEGTWFAVAPHEHSDDSTEWPDDAKYPLTSCTGDNSVEAAWNLRGHGHYDIDQETLERRIRAAADAMDCDPSIVGLGEEGASTQADSISENELDMSTKETDPDSDKSYLTNYDKDEYDDYDEYIQEVAPEHEHLYEDEEDAKSMAKEMGLGETAHKHDVDGDEYYMPGADHDEYLNAIDEMMDDLDGVDEDEYEDDEYASHEDEMYEIGAPQWEDTVEDDGPMDELTLDDWGFEESWDDLTETEQEIVSEHFLTSESGFPPDEFDDLSCAVVTADGELHFGALATHYEMVEAGEKPYSDELASDVADWIVETAQEEFDVDLEAGEELAVGASIPAVASLSEHSDYVASFTEPLQTTPMTEIEYEPANEEELADADLDEPVVVERGELEALSEQAQRADSVENEIEELSNKLDEQDEASEIVASLSEEDIDMLADSSDGDVTVIEASKADMVDQVSSIYAEELAQYSPFDAEELADRFDPLELKERVEGHDEASLSSEIGDIEPNPEAETVGEEELGADVDDKELREEMAAELSRTGWETQAQKLLDGELDPVELTE